MRVLILLFCLAPAAYAGNSLQEIAQRCAPSGGATLYSNDFSWGMTLPAMQENFVKAYASPKRLGRRAYWDSKTGTLRLPYMPERGGDVELPQNFAEAVARHIERAFELDIIDAVFFPDMGHSHFLIPQNLWETKYTHYPVEQMSKMYMEMMQDRALEVFYHTAEQLKTRDENGSLVHDERTRRRHATRNISGLNDSRTDLKIHQNPQSSANTAGEIPGYFWWGAGFNVSAQQDGCFEYQRDGKTYRFDLSLFDLEPDPAQPASGD